MLPGRQYTPEDILRMLWYRRWIVFSIAAFVTLGAIALSMQIPNTYRSETLILVIPQRVPETYVKSTVTMRIEDRLRSIQEQILSRSRLEKVIDDFNLYPDLRGRMPMEEIVRVMGNQIIVDTVRDDAFKVSFTAPAPRTAMIVADRLAAMFIDENARDRDMMAQGTSDFLESQLKDAERRLLESEGKVRAFREQYSGELPEQLESNLQIIRNKQSQIQSLSESIDRDRDRRLVLEKQVVDTLAGSSDAPVTDAKTGETTLQRLERERGELRTLELSKKPEHPDVVAKRKVVANLEAQMRAEASAATKAAPATKGTSVDLIRQARAKRDQQEIEKLDTQIAQKQADIDRLKSEAADYQRRVDAVPGHQSELVALTRDYDTLQKIYQNLLAKKEDSRISANLERQQVGEQFKILDPARLPERPYSPNRVRMALVGLGIGLGLGLGFAGFLEYRDTSLRTEDEIVKMLVLPVVAAIPVMSAIAERRRHRRNLVLTGVVSVLFVAGALAGLLWRMGLMPGLN
jgi:polysaccharide chain length determinant protein (PEP-CTERM system associated)